MGLIAPIVTRSTGPIQGVTDGEGLGPRPRPAVTLNALSVDVEDWFCSTNLRYMIDKTEWHRYELRVVANTQRLLRLFAQHNARATFFVLGWVAERVPELVQEIEAHGHEIGTHGYSHTLLTQMTPAEFAADLEKALRVTARCTRQPILGFRAPAFTITPRTLWALPILAGHGIRYDSSVYPIGFHPEYGLPDGALAIHQIHDGMLEVPLSCAEVCGRRVPCSGGAYFRLFPYRVSRFLLRRCNRQGRPVIFYVHPWEIDPGQPRIRVRWGNYLRHYYNVPKTYWRLERLLKDFQFTTIRRVVGL